MERVLMKKRTIVFFIVLVLLCSLIIIPGCYHDSLNLVEIHIPDGEIGYTFIKIDQAHPKIVYDNKILNIELIFNKELQEKQDIKLLTISGSLLPKELSQGNDFQINKSKIIIDAKINQGISSFLIPTTLKSVNDLKLKDDLYIYLASKQSSSNQSIEPAGVQKIIKKKGDGKDIGFALRQDSLPQGIITEKNLLNAFREIPLYNKPDGKEILSLKNGDGFEIIRESGNFYRVQIYYKKDSKSNAQKIQGYIEKQFVFKIPGSSSENITYTVFSQQFLCVIAKKFMGEVPDPLPYFPYIEVNVDGLGKSGVELLEREALPLTTEKMSILELNAIFNTVSKSLVIQDEFQNGDLQKIISENIAVQKYYSPFIENNSKTLLDLVDKLKVSGTLISAKQNIIDYINLKSKLLTFQVNLLTSDENFTALLNDFLNSFDGDKTTKDKLETIKKQFLAVQSKSNFRDFSNSLEANIFKPIEKKFGTLFDNAFFPEGNWVKKAFTNFRSS